jgi:hypothetical protein
MNFKDGLVAWHSLYQRTPQGRVECMMIDWLLVLDFLLHIHVVIICFGFGQYIPAAWRFG